MPDIRVIMEEFERNSRLLKDKLVKQVEMLLIYEGDSIDTALRVTHKYAVKYFCHIENFAQRVRLFHFDENPMLLRSIAEDCHEDLNSFLLYYKTIKSICQENKIDFSEFKPGIYSYSSMQILVRHMLPEIASLQVEEFHELGLPAIGAEAAIQRAEAVKSCETIPDRTSVRRMLMKQLETDAELNAFCLDFFPDVYGQFSSGMQREEKRTLLLQYVEPVDIAHRLHQWIRNR